MSRDSSALVVGGIALGALVLLARRGGAAGAQLEPTIAALTAGWRWPVEPLDTSKHTAFRDGLERFRFPTVSSGWSWRSTSQRHHNGVDIMFARRRKMREALPDRSEGFDCPAGVRAIACARGKVSVSTLDKTGGLVKVWHAGNLATQYLHLERRFVAAGDVVEAGQPLGTLGWNPIDYHLRHLHFELLLDGKTPINPEPYIHAWTHTLPQETTT